MCNFFLDCLISVCCVRSENGCDSHDHVVAVQGGQSLEHRLASNGCHPHSANIVHCVTALHSKPCSETLRQGLSANERGVDYDLKGNALQATYVYASGLMVCDLDVSELTYQELSVNCMPIYSAPAKVHPK